MKDDAAGGPLPYDPGDDDDIEIIEVVGMDDAAPPPPPSAELGGELSERDDADGDENEVVLSFDDLSPATDAADVTEARPAPAPPTDESDRERFLRAKADLENFRKRVEREREDFRLHATAELVSRMLPILDNLERALETDQATSSYDAFRDGVGLIYRQLVGELAKAGLRPVDALGQPFDPEHHEAVATEITSEARPNTVLEQFQKGYLFRRRLLRPALVKVAVASPGAEATDPDEEES